MATPRNPAQIDPGLLARKGEARPAMRRQTTDPSSDPGNELGWNDLGQPTAGVLRERAKLHVVSGEALTLTLDADRLLRLKLAATVRDLSPEAFILEALDRSLPSTSDIAALVQRLAPDGAAKGKP